MTTGTRHTIHSSSELHSNRGNPTRMLPTMASEASRLDAEVLVDVTGEESVETGADCSDMRRILTD